MQSERHDSIRPIRWTGEAIELLDQRHLPERVETFVARDVRDTCEAIAQMVVRGAPAIGITAAYGVALAARERYAASPATWKSDIEADLRSLEASRPTAVNLAWAVERMRARCDALGGDPFPALADAAVAIHEADIAANRAMGEIGAACIEAGAGVLTHCNTGALATGGYGTALGVIRSAFARGALAQVYAGETRPWLQGARLTAWELVQDAIPVRLITDSAAAYAMQDGRIQWVIVGADRVAANGDVANKIGTYALALSARYHGVKFMVAAPTSTIDLAIPNGTRIPIEVRAADELLGFGPTRLAADGADAWNPVFDVTPAKLIDVLVTERGAIWSPDAPSIARLMSA